MVNDNKFRFARQSAVQAWRKVTAKSKLANVLGKYWSWLWFAHTFQEQHQSTGINCMPMSFKISQTSGLANQCNLMYLNQKRLTTDPVGQLHNSAISSTNQIQIEAVSSVTKK